MASTHVTQNAGVNPDTKVSLLPTGPTDEEKEFARFHGWNGEFFGVCEECGRKNTCLLKEDEYEDEEYEDEESINPLVCLKCYYGNGDNVKCQECFKDFSQFDYKIMLGPYYGYVCDMCYHKYGAKWSEFNGGVVYHKR